MVLECVLILSLENHCEGCHVEEKKVEKGDSVLPATKDLN